MSVPQPDETSEATASAVTFTIERFDVLQGRWKQHLAIARRRGLTVLEALEWAWRESAPDLAYAWSCRIGRCRECTIRINGARRLACRTLLADGDVIAADDGNPLRDLISKRDVSANERASA